MAASCEPKKTKAYSDGIRWRMLYQAKVLGKTYSEIASNLTVDASTVCRIVSLFYTTGGDVSPKQYSPISIGIVHNFRGSGRQARDLPPSDTAAASPRYWH